MLSATYGDDDKVDAHENYGADLSGCAPKGKIRAVARDFIHEGALGEMMLIPISDINLDARGINISRGCVAIL